MARKLALDKLNEAIAGILNEYAGEIAGNVGEIAAQMGQKGAQALRQKSRETVDGSEYAKGWKSQTETGRTGTTAIIYNDHPGLPHLLEYGHVTRNGTGRTFPRTPAHEHIAPVADELTETFEREVLSRL
ncbi:MAG: hypothetical protein IKD53_00915 [Clostridia bacterium]|nr:hypothetical protein [Clostridia bacterium]